MLSIAFHSLTARLSHSSSFKTAVRGSLTFSSRSNKRNVDDHLVGQLDHSFLPHLAINNSVAFVDLLIFLTREYVFLSVSSYVVLSLNFCTISCMCKTAYTLGKKLERDIMVNLCCQNPAQTFQNQNQFHLHLHFLH